MRGRTWWATPLLVSMVYALPGCGYTLVRKRDAVPRRLAANSAQIVSLQRQIAALQAQCRADSARYTQLTQLKPNTVSTVSDSLLRAKDDEIASLRDQVSRLNVELDRI